MIQSSETHVFRTAGDALIAELAGLPPISNTETCAVCGTDIGFLTPEFTPAVLIMADMYHGFFCISCAGPVVHVT